MKKFLSRNPTDTFKIADRLSNVLDKGDVVSFYGQLGAGKTTFIKGISKNFGVAKNKVISSSFIVLRVYQGKIPIYHVDLYRLNPKQVPDEVYEYIRQKDGLTLVEWAERLDVPQEHFKVSIELKRLKRRSITINSSHPDLEGRLKRL